MLKEHIKVIVEESVREFLAQKQVSTKLFILLVGRSQLHQEIRVLVEELVKQNSQVTLATCSLWSRTVDSINVHKHIELDAFNEQEPFALLNEVLQADVLLLPNLTLSMLAKLALTIDDTLSAWLVIQAQFKGKIIVAATDNIENGVEEMLWTPASVKSKQTGYLQQLQRDQIKLTVLRKFPEAVKWAVDYSQQKRPTLLAKHIEHLADQKHTHVDLPENAIITPLARELAREYKMELTTIRRKGEFNDRS